MVQLSTVPMSTPVHSLQPSFFKEQRKNLVRALVQSWLRFKHASHTEADSEAKIKNRSVVHKAQTCFCAKDCSSSF